MNLILSRYTFKVEPRSRIYLKGLTLVSMSLKVKVGR
jgi:hypothetical protein